MDGADFQRHMENDNIIPFRRRAQAEEASPIAQPRLHDLPTSFLRSLDDKTLSERRISVRREVGRICSTLANEHRFFVLADHVPQDEELRYKGVVRLQSAVQQLAKKFGRAAMHNLGGVLVHFNHSGRSAWVQKPEQRETLHLNNDFIVQELVDLISPKLNYETQYRHEWFDVSEKNRR